MTNVVVMQTSCCEMIEIVLKKSKVSGLSDPNGDSDMKKRLGENDNKSIYSLRTNIYLSEETVFFCYCSKLVEMRKENWQGQKWTLTNSSFLPQWPATSSIRYRELLHHILTHSKCVRAVTLSFSASCPSAGAGIHINQRRNRSGQLWDFDLFKAVSLILRSLHPWLLLWCLCPGGGRPSPEYGWLLSAPPLPPPPLSPLTPPPPPSTYRRVEVEGREQGQEVTGASGWNGVLHLQAPSQLSPPWYEDTRSQNSLPGAAGAHTAAASCPFLSQDHRSLSPVVTLPHRETETP